MVRKRRDELVAAKYGKEFLGAPYYKMFDEDTRENICYKRLSRKQILKGVAWHRGSILAFHPAAPGSNPSSVPEI